MKKTINGSRRTGRWARKLLNKLQSNNRRQRKRDLTLRIREQSQHHR